MVSIKDSEGPLCKPLLTGVVTALVSSSRKYSSDIFSFRIQKYLPR